MQVLLKKNVGPVDRTYSSSESAKKYREFLQNNAGKWIDVETSYLFNDQYNTAGGRIFDSQIDAVRDDARRDMGKCRFCGALIRRGEEEKHFEEREKSACILDAAGVVLTPCAGRCFWMRSRRINEKTEVEEKALLNGREVVKRITWEREENYCTHGESCKEHGWPVCQCEKSECRAHGVEWFTEKNTFFLKYPEGRGCPRLLVPGESVKIGSYTLSRGGYDGGADYYEFGNYRRRILFVWDETAEEWRRLSGIGYNYFGKFGDVPFSVREKLRAFLLVRGEICRAINRGFCDAARRKLAFSDLGGACLEIMARFEAEKRRELVNLTAPRDEKRRIAVFCEWCGGLCSAFRPEFETYKQLEALRKWGGRVPSENNAADVYYAGIAAEVFAVCAWAKMAGKK